MPLLSELAALESAGLIRLSQVEPDLEYFFRHALVQEAAYASLLIEDRKRLHLHIGQAIERLYPGRTAEFSPLLSHHFLQAENFKKALKYSKLAAEKALQMHSNQEAIIHFSNAIYAAENLPDSSHLDRTRAMLFTMLGSAYIATRGEGSRHPITADNRRVA